MRDIKFDFNNMMAHAVGAKDGVTEKELKSATSRAGKAYRNIQKVLANAEERVNIGLEWAQLPYQDKQFIDSIQKLGDEIAARYENVISLGIGGSYLGLKAAQDALAPAYYNEFAKERKGRPKIYFDGNNLDPDTLNALTRNLDPHKTFVIVISKSGETTETKAAFTIIENWLKKYVGKYYGRQVFAITDPKSGTLRRRADAEQYKDSLSFRNMPVLKGVGGRFSVLNTGLLHLAIAGIKIQDVLDGAAAMAERCSSPNLTANPALMYAALHTILYRRKGKSNAVIMPFSERLKSTADWYVQLLAESLGKKYDRSKKIVNVGRTPISARGTSDLHSIQQNNIEGENNKATTFIRVTHFSPDILLDGTEDFLSGNYYSKLLGLAEEATEWALVMENRPSCTITISEISPYIWGCMVFFFEMATAYEGELLDVNAFDQPGVEGYKNYMYYKLGKPGLSGETKRSVEENPFIKKKRFII